MPGAIPNGAGFQWILVPGRPVRPRRPRHGRAFGLPLRHDPVNVRRRRHVVVPTLAGPCRVRHRLHARGRSIGCCLARRRGIRRDARHPGNALRTTAPCQPGPGGLLPAEVLFDIIYLMRNTGTENETGCRWWRSARALAASGPACGHGLPSLRPDRRPSLLVEGVAVVHWLEPGPVCARALRRPRDPAPRPRLHGRPVPGR